MSSRQGGCVFIQPIRLWKNENGAYWVDEHIFEREMGSPGERDVKRQRLRCLLDKG